MPASDSCRPAQRTLRAGCKVNLYLRIGERRPDGLHNLESFLLPLPEPADTLSIEPGEPGSGFSLSCSLPELEDGSNILVSAWKLFAERTGWRPDLRVRLDKGIPVGAGLGGGSSDAAALLLTLAEEAPEAQRPSRGLLAEMAARLGADVPFFLQREPAWAEGAGELLRPARLELPPCRLLVVCPDLRIATREAYRALDAARAGQEDLGRSQALTSPGNVFTENLRLSGRLFSNSFEQVIFDAHPVLGSIKRELLKLGASASVLSGSGAALVAAFREGHRLGPVRAFLRHQALPWYEAVVSGWGVAKR